MNDGKRSVAVCRLLPARSAAGCVTRQSHKQINYGGISDLREPIRKEIKQDFGQDLVTL